MNTEIAVAISLGSVLVGAAVGFFGQLVALAAISILGRIADRIERKRRKGFDIYFDEHGFMRLKK